MIQIDVSREAPWPDGDWDTMATRAAHAAIAGTPYGDLLTSAATIEISIRLASDDDVQALNTQYRHQDKPTNVLSFPMIQPDLLETVTQNSDDGEVLLGDIVLAYGVCVAEAAAKSVSVEHHATHLVVHGTLHLLGYDHLGNGDADAMEEIERSALASLGIADPYLADPD